MANCIHNPSGRLPAEAPAILTIDLDALISNYRLFQSMTQASVAGVLKADAYGTGAGEVFEALLKAGCREFFVATPDEALSLKRQARGRPCTIYHLGGLYQGAEDEFAAGGIVPVLNTPEEITRWNAQANANGKKLDAALHFDTGMNRLGLSGDETRALLDDPSVYEALTIGTVMSHFVESDSPGSMLSESQAAQFANIAARFPQSRKSLANSSALFRNNGWHHDLVRPGYALYGGNPAPERENPVKPVIALEARVLQVRQVRKGESAGYNAAWRFEKDSEAAVLALGYADGFLRSASNSAKVFWKGQPCPVRGRVSMDLTIIETGHMEDRPKPGDYVEVIGPHQDVDALAGSCGTIGYEILTSLGPRYRRVYRHRT